ncbi:MAG: 2-hydroxyacid dehydrogenase [Acetobacteraceae bacterium]|nr:2-hydroxyacid dehydrogenase [Acetobacteraceae bacterium]MCX7685231.1 2-hydroxyacid dehydrogenase [Acetobacteraceae bacterium]MDW8399713.1 2-hydroxyacid dehydrogenase [Acetobacteraceae bacterium]
MPRPEILILSPALPPETLAALAERFTCHGPPRGDLDSLLSAHGPRIAGIATTGRERLDAAMLERLPALKVVACMTAGTEGIDDRALAARGIRLRTSGPVLADDVADLAIALLVMARRRLVQADAYLRAGEWAKAPFPLQRRIAGRRLGLLGIGHLGRAIARRAEAMNVSLRYCARSRRPDLPWPFHPDPVSLAADSDMLIVCCTGGPENHGLVGEAVFRALGPEGTLVNVSRGEVLDEEALIAALESGALGSAGLDVFRNEPTPDPRFARLPNVALAPHVGSATVETRAAMAASVVTALVEALG